LHHKIDPVASVQLGLVILSHYLEFQSRMTVPDACPWRAQASYGGMEITL